MKITKSVESGVNVLHLNGAMDTNTAPDAEDAIMDCLEEMPWLVLDLEKNHYMSSAGLRVIISAHKQAIRRNGYLKVKSPSPMVYELFEMTGFTKFLDIIK